MRILLAILSVVLLAGQGVGEPLVLADKGQAKATIVVAADAPDKVKAVAQELQHYLEKISGAKLAVASEADNPQGTLVLVGPGKTAAAMGVAIPSGLTSAGPQGDAVCAGGGYGGLGLGERAIRGASSVCGIVQPAGAVGI